jgi:hypothetical protein
MKKTSKKVLKAPARKRNDYGAGCRLTSNERDAVMHDVEKVKAASGFPLTLGAYTKHALMDHGRLRNLEKRIRDFHEAAAADLKDEELAVDITPKWMLESIEAILTGGA